MPLDSAATTGRDDELAWLALAAVALVCSGCGSHARIVRDHMPHNRSSFEVELQRTWPTPNLMAGTWTDSAGAVIQCEAEPRGDGPFAATLLGLWRSAPESSDVTVTRFVVRDATIEVEMRAMDEASAGKAKTFSGTYHRLPDDLHEMPAADAASSARTGKTAAGDV